MPRIIWKGAISFGLVHVPIALYPASQDSGVDFDWLDDRTMDPVGYQRINKRTGREIDKDHIVKGIQQENGEYVVLGEDEIKAAYPKSTQTVEIEHFVRIDEISYVLLERPYFTAPIGKGEKVYALLREAMREAGVVGIARVVLHTKERLAALVADGDALILNTIRWADELRDRGEIAFPPAGKAGIKDTELKMARQLISDMTAPFKPHDYSDRFTAAIHKLAAARVKAGKTEQVTPIETGDAPPSESNVVDLTALLKQSLSAKKQGHAAAAPKPARKTRRPRAKAA